MADLCFLAVGCCGKGIDLYFVHPFEFTEPFPKGEVFSSYGGQRYLEMMTSTTGASQYMVTVEVTSLHIQKSAALASGLFGRLAEERVRQIHVTDLAAIQAYHNLWATGPSEDQDLASDTAKFFDIALRFRSEFLARTGRWQLEVKKIRLMNKSDAV